MTEKLTTVLLIRHAKATTTGSILPGRTPGLHLSEEGLAQAHATADFLQGSSVELDSVFASPMERAQETAQPIADKYGLYIKTEASVVEADFGEWTGQPLDDLRKLPEWQTVQETPSEFRFPGGESFVEMQTRVIQGINNLADTNAGKTIAIVSHADTIKAALAHFLDMPLDSFQRLVVSPCSISVVVFASTTQVLCINQTAGNMPNLKLG